MMPADVTRREFGAQTMLLSVQASACAGDFTNFINNKTCRKQLELPLTWLDAWQRAARRAGDDLSEQEGFTRDATMPDAPVPRAEGAGV